MGFVENILWPKSIDIYQFRGWGGHTRSILHFLFIIEKIEKVQEHDLH